MQEKRRGRGAQNPVQQTKRGAQDIVAKKHSMVINRIASLDEEKNRPVPGSFH